MAFDLAAWRQSNRTTLLRLGLCLRCRKRPAVLFKNCDECRADMRSYAATKKTQARGGPEGTEAAGRRENSPQSAVYKCMLALGKQIRHEIAPEDTLRTELRRLRHFIDVLLDENGLQL